MRCAWLLPGSLPQSRKSSQRVAEQLRLHGKRVPRKHSRCSVEPESIQERLALSTIKLGFMGSIEGLLRRQAFTRLDKLAGRLRWSTFRTARGQPVGRTVPARLGRKEFQWPLSTRQQLRVTR